MLQADETVGFLKRNVANVGMSTTSCHFHDDATRCSDTFFVWNCTKISKLIALTQASICEKEDSRVDGRHSCLLGLSGTRLILTDPLQRKNPA